MKIKYILTENTKEIDRHTLYQIMAVKHIYINGEDEEPEVESGELGGWIESEENLSHKGSCWVDNDSCVYGKAKVYGGGIISGGAIVCENAEGCDRASVHGSSKIRGNAVVCGNSSIFEFGIVEGDAYVKNSSVSGRSKIYGHAYVKESILYGDTRICGNTHIENSEIFGFAKIYGDIRVKSAILYDNADISKPGDYFSINGFGMSGKSVTFFKSADGKVKTSLPELYEAYPYAFAESVNSFKSIAAECYKRDKIWADRASMLAEFAEKYFAEKCINK